MVRNFNKADSVLEYSNKDSGTMSGKYVYDDGNTIEVTGHGLGLWVKMARAIMTVEIKDEKVRFTCRLSEKYSESGFENTYSWKPISGNDVANLHFGDIYNSLVASLKKYVTNKNDNW